MARLRVATVGAGYFSQFQLAGWRNIAAAELVAIADRDRAKAEAAAVRFGVPRTFSAFEEMLDATHPDLVDIVTPPPTHHAFVAAAAARRIPVVCQKPFGTDYADAVAMTELAERAGVPLVVHENFRWQPW